MAADVSAIVVQSDDEDDDHELLHELAEALNALPEPDVESEGDDSMGSSRSQYGSMSQGQPSHRRSEPFQSDLDSTQLQFMNTSLPTQQEEEPADASELVRLRILYQSQSSRVKELTAMLKNQKEAHQEHIDHMQACLAQSQSEHQDLLLDYEQLQDKMQAAEVAAQDLEEQTQSLRRQLREAQHAAAVAKADQQAAHVQLRDLQGEASRHTEREQATASILAQQQLEALQSKLREQQAAHHDQIEDMRRAHQEEIGQLESRLAASTTMQSSSSATPKKQEWSDIDRLLGFGLDESSMSHRDSTSARADMSVDMPAAHELAAVATCEQSTQTVGEKQLPGQQHGRESHARATDEDVDAHCEQEHKVRKALLEENDVCH